MILRDETLCHPATIMRRRVFDEVGKFDTSFTIAGDYDLIVRCFAHPVTTKFVPEIISRMSMGGISEDRFMLSCRERKRVVRSRFKSITRFTGVWRVNLYDIPRNTARQWLARPACSATGAQPEAAVSRPVSVAVSIIVASYRRADSLFDLPRGSCCAGHRRTVRVVLVLQAYPAERQTRSKRHSEVGSIS